MFNAFTKRTNAARLGIGLGPGRRPLFSLSSFIAPNQQHTSLATYLAYARRNGLSPTTSTFLGTRYEYIVSDTLRRLGIDTVRVGQAGDRGVDLIGNWYLPSSQRQENKTSTSTGTGVDNETEWTRPAPPLRVVVQCKRLTKKVTPSVVRELEGSFRAGHGPQAHKNDSSSSSSSKDASIGILVGTMAATKGVVDGLKRAGAAVVWVCVEEVAGQEPPTQEMPGQEQEQEQPADEEGEYDNEKEQQALYYKVKAGRIRQVLWNHKASALGLEGVDVVKRHYTTPHEQLTGDEVELHWRGRKVDSLPPALPFGARPVE